MQGQVLRVSGEGLQVEGRASKKVLRWKHGAFCGNSKEASVAEQSKPVMSGGKSISVSEVADTAPI